MFIPVLVCERDNDKYNVILFFQSEKGDVRCPTGRSWRLRDADDIGIAITEMHIELTEKGIDFWGEYEKSHAKHEITLKEALEMEQVALNRVLIEVADIEPTVPLAALLK